MRYDVYHVTALFLKDFAYSKRSSNDFIIMINNKVIIKANVFVTVLQ